MDQSEAIIGLSAEELQDVADDSLSALIAAERIVAAHLAGDKADPCDVYRFSFYTMTMLGNYGLDWSALRTSLPQLRARVSESFVISSPDPAPRR